MSEKSSAIGLLTELPASTNRKARQQIIDSLQAWKYVVYPNAPVLAEAWQRVVGEPWTMARYVELTNRIVCWCDQHTQHIDVAPLDEVRRILVRRATGESTPEEELRTAAERAARACDRLSAWLTSEAPKQQRRRRRATLKEPTPLTPEQAEAVQLVGEHKGNISAAAKAAGKSRQAVQKLYDKGMKKLGRSATLLKPKSHGLPHDRRGQVDILAEEEE